MPKQKGLYNIKGKFEGRSYYRLPHGVGEVFRGIDPNLSENVKSLPSYNLLRANAAEFGVCSRLVQVIFDAIPDREKYLRKGLTRAQFTKSVVSVLRDDTTNPVGMRTITADYGRAVLSRIINQQTKCVWNQNYPSFVLSYGSSGSTSLASTLEFSMSASSLYYWRNLGFDGVRIQNVALAFTLPVRSDFEGKYFPITTDMPKYDASVVEFNFVDYAPDEYQANFVAPFVPRRNSDFMCSIVTFVPFKMVGGVANYYAKYAAFKCLTDYNLV